MKTRNNKPRERAAYDKRRTRHRLREQFKKEGLKFAETLPDGYEQIGYNLFSDGKTNAIRMRKEEQGYFLFDPDKVQVDTFDMNKEEQSYDILNPLTEEMVHLKPRSEEMKQAFMDASDRGWTYVGFEEDGSWLFARPWLTNAEAPRVDGVEMFVYKNLVPQYEEVPENPDEEPPDMESRPQYELVLQCGTLQAHIYESFVTGPDQVVVDIVRVSEDERGKASGLGIHKKGADAEGRSPGIASDQMAFFRQMRLLLEQVKALGYKEILAAPTDERRNRVYKLAGMQDADMDDVLIGKIDDILDARIMKRSKRPAAVSTEPPPTVPPASQG